MMTIDELIEELNQFKDRLPAGGLTNVVFETDWGARGPFVLFDNADDVITDGEQFADVEVVIMAA